MYQVIKKLLFLSRRMEWSWTAKSRLGRLGAAAARLAEGILSGRNFAPSKDIPV